jgi:hypothetical protein
LTETLSAGTRTQQRTDRRVFSPRLTAFLEQLQAGDTPNSGSFCSFCYNPLPPGFERCDHCSQALSGRRPITSLPEDVVEMHRRMLKRESLIVNSFAYLGLALGLILFLGMVAVNVLYMNRALWFFILATLVLMVGTRILAGIVGGVIGDEIGYRMAGKQLAEDWAAHVAERETNRQE